MTIVGQIAFFYQNIFELEQLSAVPMGLCHIILQFRDPAIEMAGNEMGRPAGTGKE